ncbi:GNAT family N-acetyltransferase [Flagellimonas allohymeniacidonis]|uniref:GNAT family N-acetyltransferase n=1 Tax=Flagellimonas allohymeniacidonis TaxID=2517819 RepID=A0A4V2HSI0_9FLAO|nr:GNAT family N-acetyltransferase [Allomuricauda hymeniacidonis]TAI47760.1 GNAT family N-acetyltransferase [Allomuricauda hymeniacidonis]
MDNFTIADYQPSDFQAWLNMSLKLFKDYPAEETERGLVRMAQNPKCKTFLAKFDNSAVGFITVSVRTDYVEGSKTSPTGYVEAIFVDAKYRKQGLAKLLFEKGEQWTKLQGCSEIGSDTWDWNLAAQDFHLKLGFQKEDVLVHFIKKIPN